MRRADPSGKHDRMHNVAGSFIFSATLQSTTFHLYEPPIDRNPQCDYFRINEYLRWAGSKIIYRQFLQSPQYQSARFSAISCQWAEISIPHRFTNRILIANRLSSTGSKIFNPQPLHDHYPIAGNSNLRETKFHLTILFLFTRGFGVPLFFNLLPATDVCMRSGE